MKTLQIMSAGFCLATALVNAMNGEMLMTAVMLGFAIFNLEMGVRK